MTAVEDALPWMAVTVCHFGVVWNYRFNFSLFSLLDFWDLIMIETWTGESGGVRIKFAAGLVKLFTSLEVTAKFGHPTSLQVSFATPPPETKKKKQKERNSNSGKENQNYFLALLGSNG